jgi:hypothetical protein
MKLLSLMLLLVPVAQDPDLQDLIKRLDDESIQVRDKAAAALVALGEKAEAPLRKALAGSRDPLKKQIETVLQSITRNRNLAAALPPVKKITLEGKDRPWKDYAKDFEKQTGWPVDLDAAPETAVTFSIKDASPFEALDALCRAGGTGYMIERLGPFAPKPAGPRGLIPPVDILDDPSAVVFHRDRHTLGPCQYTRQYSVSLTGVGLLKMNDFKAPVSHGVVSLHLRWPPTARPEALREFRVSSIRTDTREELYDPKIDAVLEGLGEPMLWPEGKAELIHFTHPSPEARKISVKGRVHLRYGVDDVVVGFPRPDASVGEKREFDGIQIHLTEHRKEGDEVYLSFDVTGKRLTPPAGRRGCFASGDDKLRILKEFIRIRTRDGEEPRQDDTGLYIKPDRYVVRLHYVGVKSVIESIEFIMETVYHSDTFEFEFKDIDLPK